jgi:hypothetical protein
MTTAPGPKRQGPTLLLILAIAILLDKFGISRLLPEVSGLIGINPMLVFLDIPIDLSLGFGLLPVTVLFILFCLTLPHSWKIITGVLAIPCCTLSGGLLYAAAHDHLPKQARHAIESFGINADIYTSFPGYELIHLRGSMIMLACMLVGIQICIRRIRVPAPEPIPVQTLIC